MGLFGLGRKKQPKKDDNSKPTLDNAVLDDSKQPTPEQMEQFALKDSDAALQSGPESKKGSVQGTGNSPEFDFSDLEKDFGVGSQIQPPPKPQGLKTDRKTREQDYGQPLRAESTVKSVEEIDPFDPSMFESKKLVQETKREDIESADEFLKAFEKELPEVIQAPESKQVKAEVKGEVNIKEIKEPPKAEKPKEETIAPEKPNLDFLKRRREQFALPEESYAESYSYPGTGSETSRNSSLIWDRTGTKLYMRLKDLRHVGVDLERLHILTKSIDGTFGTIRHITSFEERMLHHFETELNELKNGLNEMDRLLFQNRQNE